MAMPKAISPVTVGNTVLFLFSQTRVSLWIFERNGRIPGGIFPDYELPESTGKVRKLNDLHGHDPLSPRPL